jgi:hypothetical protein
MKQLLAVIVLSMVASVCGAQTAKPALPQYNTRIPRVTVAVSRWTDGEIDIDVSCPKGYKVDIPENRLSNFSNMDARSIDDSIKFLTDYATCKRKIPARKTVKK